MRLLAVIGLVGVVIATSPATASPRSCPPIAIVSGEATVVAPIIEQLLRNEIADPQKGDASSQGRHPQSQHARAEKLQRRPDDPVVEGRLTLNLDRPRPNFAKAVPRHDPGGSVLVDPQGMARHVVCAQRAPDGEHQQGARPLDAVRRVCGGPLHGGRCTHRPALRRPAARA